MDNRTEESLILQLKPSRKSPKHLPRYIFAFFILGLSSYFLLMGIPSVGLPIQPQSLENVTFQFLEYQMNATEAPLILLTVVGLFYIVYLEIDRMKIKYMLTESSVMEKKGILSKSNLSLNLARINNITIDQKITHRIIGAGSLRIETDTSSLFLENINNPHEIKGIIQETINKRFKSTESQMSRFKVPTRRGSIEGGEV